MSYEQIELKHTEHYKFDTAAMGTAIVKKVTKIMGKEYILYKIVAEDSEGNSFYYYTNTDLKVGDEIYVVEDSINEQHYIDIIDGITYHFGRSVDNPDAPAFGFSNDRVDSVNEISRR